MSCIFPIFLCAGLGSYHQSASPITYISIQQYIPYPQLQSQKNSYIHILYIQNNKMNAFKKKPQQVPTIEQKVQKLNMLLGLGCSQVFSNTNNNTNTNSDMSNPSNKCILNRQLILSSAMFWDSKQRIDRIKSLVIKGVGLEEFNDTHDFQVSELSSIQLLSLSTNSIMHLQPLSNLDTLICLNINNNKIYDISPLEPLKKLQQLYAANNQISHIDVLKQLYNLRIVNLYNNKLARLQETINILTCLNNLEELDIQQNQLYSEAVRGRFISIGKLARFNGQLIMDEEREELGLPNTSVVIVPTAKFRDTHTSFFNMNKSKISKSTAIQKQSTSSAKIFKSKAELSESVQQLQQKYLQIDDKFEEEIVRNVQLKSELSKKSEEKKLLERKMSQIKEKEEQIVQLKRKVKMLKQNLFNNPQAQRKGQLLRQLFDLQMMSQTPKNPQKPSSSGSKTDKDRPWVRKFDYDQQITIGVHQNDNKYLLDEDEQLALLLSQNNSALQQLKRELREINQ